MNATPTALQRASKIALGCVTFGREIKEADALALLDAAWDRDIRHFDTAAAYGTNGASEIILGKWAAAHDGAKIVTKILPPYGKDEVRRKIDESLGRLRLNSVAVLYLHRWDPTLDEHALEALHEAKMGGLVSQLGITNVTAAQLRDLLETQRRRGWTPFDWLQCNQNYAVSEFDAPMATVCADYKLSVETFSPLGAGFLTGKHRAGVVPGSRFDLVPGHQRIYFTDAAQARLDKLQQVSTETRVPAEHLALAWALRRGVDTVLIGARHTGQIDQAIKARDFPAVEALAMLDA
jgi:1-deoxyxylulose-5-phosphate synthase